MNEIYLVILKPIPVKLIFTTQFLCNIVPAQVGKNAR